MTYSVHVFSTLDQTPDGYPYIAQIWNNGEWHPVIFRSNSMIVARQNAANWYEEELSKARKKHEALAKAREAKAKKGKADVAKS